MQTALVSISTVGVIDALPVLDGIIACNTKEYSGKRPRLHCARSMAETLGYMTLAATPRAGSTTHDGGTTRRSPSSRTMMDHIRQQRARTPPPA